MHLEELYNGRPNLLVAIGKDCVHGEARRGPFAGRELGAQIGAVGPYVAGGRCIYWRWNICAYGYCGKASWARGMLLLPSGGGCVRPERAGLCGTQ